MYFDKSSCFVFGSEVTVKVSFCFSPSCFRQQALFHVLAAYSMYNTEVGYCQGMSEVAALMLMYLNEEVRRKKKSWVNPLLHKYSTWI